MTALFSTPKAPAAPSPKEPAPMPDAQSPAVLAAQRKAQADILARAGRSSTILTSPDRRPASGTPYASKSLGAGV